jgi:hypothetical protein
MLESYNDKSIKGYVEEYLPVPNETGPQTNATWRDTLDATCTYYVGSIHVMFLYALFFKYKTIFSGFLGSPKERHTQFL